MEILNFLRLDARRIASLVALALLVAIPTSAVLLRGSPTYDGTVTVRLSALLPDGGSFYLWQRLTQDFQVALGLPEVADKVGAETGVAPGAVQGGLTATLPDKGDLVTVTHADADPTTSLAVAKAASVAALDVLVKQAADQATAATTAADEAVNSAIADFQAYVSTAASSDPLSTASAIASQISQLELSQARGTAPADAATQVSALQAELQGILAATPRYREVSDKLATTRAAAQQALQAQTEAQSVEAATTSGSLVTIKGVAEQSRALNILTAGLGAGAAAVLLALGILALREMRRPADEPEVPMRPAPSTLDRLARWPERRFRVAWLLLVPVGIVGAFATLALLESGKTALALAVALPMGIAAGALALTNFEAFVIALIVLRASLDAFNLTSTSANGSSIDPGVVIGAVFIVCGALWLLAQRRSGNWVRVSRPTWALWAFAGACVLSIPTSLARFGSTVSTSKVIAGVLMFAVLEQYLGRRPERARLVLMGLFASFIIPALAALKQWISGEGNSYLVDVSRVTGTFTHPSTLADYLLIVLPLSLLLSTYCRGRARVALIAMTGIGYLLLILTYTRAAWLAALVSLAYLAVKWKRELLPVLLAGVVVLLIAVPSVAGRFADLGSAPPAAGAPANSLSWRVGYWQRLIPMANANPITGIGFDAAQRVTDEGLAPHNVFVQAYVETGLLGLGAIFAILWTFTSMLRKRVRHAPPGLPLLLALGAAASALATLAQFPGENLVSQTMVYWYLAAAMTYGIGMEHHRTRRPPTTTAAPAPEPPLAEQLVGASR